MLAEDIEKAAELLRKGGVVAFPTETVYGLGAHALNVQAVERVYQLKQRPRSSPLIVHVSSIAAAQDLVSAWPPLAQKLAERFWPGALTLVLPKQRIVPGIVTAGLPAVGIRMPAHALAMRLLERAGIPVAAPSANRFTQISPTTAEHVLAGLPGVDMVLDGGPCTVGLESTVVSLIDDMPRVLRPGMISREHLEQATGVKWLTQVPESAENANLSPGLHPRHYSPRTPFWLLSKGMPTPSGRGHILSLPKDPAAYAKSLYAELHAADAAGWDWIAVEEPPDTPEWEAIRDRLQRAARR